MKYKTEIREKMSASTIGLFQNENWVFSALQINKAILEFTAF